MNGSKIVYRKEYVETAIEHIKQALEDLEETSSIIDEKINAIIQSNEFPYIEQKDKNLIDTTIQKSLKEITTETEENLKILEEASLAIESYEMKEKNYINPLTQSTPEPKIKNGPAIAAVAGAATIGAAALISSKEEKEEEKEKTES